MQHWIGLAALTQGLGWMGKNPFDVGSIASIHTHHVRYLQMVTSSTSSSSSTSSMFGSSNELDATENDEMTKMMELVKDKCHLDVEELGMKVALLVMSNGGGVGMSAPGSEITSGSSMSMTDDMGMSNKPAASVTQETSVEDQVAFVKLINEAVTPPGEKRCTKAQDEKFAKASAKFAKCLGINPEKKVDIDKEHMKEISAACDMGAVMLNPDNCTDTVLSDQVIGSALRDLYQRPGVYCSCLNTLKTDLPACTLSLGQLMDESGEAAPEGFDELYRDMTVSLGFLKSELCVIGLGCDAVKDACVQELNDLEQCLTENGGNCANDDPPAVCTNSTIFGVPPALSQGLIPDICLSEYQNKKMKSAVVSDYAKYVHNCHADAIATTTATATAIKTATNVESEPGMSKTPGWVDAMVITGVIAVAVLGAVMAAVFLKRKQAKGVFQPINTDEATEASELDMEEMS